MIWLGFSRTVELASYHDRYSSIIFDIIASSSDVLTKSVCLSPS